MKSSYTINRFMVLLAFLLSVSIMQGVAVEKGQKRSVLERRADVYFLRHKYDQAMSLYETLVKRETKTENVTRLHLKMARLYFMLGQYASATSCYSRLVEADKNLPTMNDVCDFIDAYRFMGEDQKAEAVCLSYTYKDVFSRHQRYQNVLNVLTKHFNIIGEENYAVTLHPSNDSETDLLIGELDGKRFLVKSKSGFNPSEKLFFHRIRYYEMEEKNEHVRQNRQRGGSQGSHHPFYLVPRDLQGGPATFSSQRGLMVTAVLQYDTPDQIVLGEDNPFKSKLVYSKLDKGGKRYSRYLPLFPQEENASFTYPFLFHDGRSMFFSSDMLGGYGGFDLYVIHWDEAKQAWGFPVNLGPTINTDGDEISPVLFHDKLIFASNGHSGFGGYDLFNVTYTEGSLATPYHLPYPMNSVYNDFYMYPLDTDTGYIISDRNKGMQDDVYYYQFKAPILSNNIPHLSATEQSLMNQQVKSKATSLNLPERLLSLYFDFDHSDLTPWALRLLEEFTGAYKDRSFGSLEILGYTDEVGTDNYNLLLSRRRAEMVARALQGRGIRVPMKVVGRGKMLLVDPAFEGNDGVYRSANARRVDIYTEQNK
jgi:outer membrane protein OmpA-like peptidoglycan-associated protein